jgi:hypothetical protein
MSKKELLIVLAALLAGLANIAIGIAWHSPENLVVGGFDVGIVAVGVWMFR